MGQGSPSLPLSSRTLSSCILQTSPSVVPQESLSSPWAQQFHKTATFKLVSFHS